MHNSRVCHCLLFHERGKQNTKPIAKANRGKSSLVVEMASEQPGYETKVSHNSYMHAEWQVHQKLTGTTFYANTDLLKLNSVRSTQP